MTATDTTDDRDRYSGLGLGLIAQMIGTSANDWDRY